MSSETTKNLQTVFPPIDELNNLNKYIDEILSTYQPNALGVIVDEEFKNIIFTLLKENTPLAFFRFMISFDDTQSFIRRLMFKGLRFYAHTSQGYKIDDTSLSDYNKLNKIWFDTIHQEKEIKDENRIFKKNEDPKNELEYFIDRIYNFSIAKGRGDDLNTSSKNQVVNESHGRCMFKGCGEKLNVDLITGTAGTYGSSLVIPTITTDAQGRVTAEIGRAHV